MIPDTKNGLPAMACVSAMQKSIRRGLEREAMEFAVELMHTCKAFHSMVCNRLEVICHEDLDTLAAPWVVPFVATALAQSRERYSKSIGEARLMVGNCDPHDVPITEVPCRLPLRCGHRAAVACLEDFVPDDTRLGQRSAHARRAKHGPWPRSFPQRGREAGPAADSDDPYEDEAYRLWTIKQQGKGRRGPVST